MSGMGQGRWLLGALIMMAVGMPAAQAEIQEHAWSNTPKRTSGSDRVEEAMGRYNLHPAFQKGGRGVANFFGGWLEIPLGMHQRYSKNDTAGSMATGLAYGLFKGAVRTGVGLYEMVTFFLPYPEDYAPILPTLAYYEKTTKRKPYPLE